MDTDIPDKAEALLGRLKARGLSVVTAESCTAGLLAAALSDAPGAADHFKGGFVVYAKDHKTAALGVPPALLRAEGPVCPAVAARMAEGAIARSNADLAIAITGVTGPDPDEDGNPVGKVCIGIALAGIPTRTGEFYYGRIERQDVRQRAIADALAAAERALDNA